MLRSDWASLSSQPRVALWLSLLSDAMMEPRWDYRLFRCFNLLEGVASEAAPRDEPVLDDSGNPRLQANGQPYTTKHARGKVFWLLLKLSSSRTQAESFFSGRRSDGTTFGLWDEVGLWVNIRNEVAHTGSWDRPMEQLTSPVMAAADAEIMARSHDGSALDGQYNVARTIRNSVEAVIRAGLADEL